MNPTIGNSHGQHANGSTNASESPPHAELTITVNESISNGNIFSPIQNKDRILLEWNNINCSMPDLAAKRSSTLHAAKNVVRVVTGKKMIKKELPPQKQILYGVGGFAAAGEIMALMGPSGSGKTSLLSILTNRAAKSMKRSGTVTYNGLEVNKSIKRLVGYVAQDDFFLSNLTAFETLYYAALLKLPQEMNRAEKVRRVEAVMDALGLEKCRDTVIGGLFRPGISGGEKKKLSVGHELLINPPVMILDEPTSGLDSATALQIVSCLQVLANRGRVVVMAVHQPSSRIFQQLNKLMLLADGRVMYFGDSQQASHWFEMHGCPLPQGVHVADFMLDLANENVEARLSNGLPTKLYLLQQMEDFLSENIDGVNALESVSTVKTRIASLKENISKEAFLQNVQNIEKWGATFSQQVVILLSRAARNRRFETLVYQNFFQAVGAALFTILMWWQRGDGHTLLAASDVSSALFFMLLHVQYELMFKGIYTFPLTLFHMLKERASGMYRLSAFYISETLCDLPLDYSVPLIFVICVYWGVHLRQRFSAFIYTVFAVVLSGLNVQSIGLLVGTSIPSPKNAISFATVLMIAIVLATGFFVRDVPDWMGWLKYLVAPYWAYRLLLQIQFSDKEYYNCGGISEDQLPIDQCTPITDLGDELHLPVDTEGAQWVSVVVLLCMLVLFRFMVYAVLKAATSLL